MYYTTKVQYQSAGNCPPQEDVLVDGKERKGVKEKAKTSKVHYFLLPQPPNPLLHTEFSDQSSSSDALPNLQRVATFTRAFREAAELLGERRKEMIELAGLVTRQEKQGRGYGSALVRAVTNLACVIHICLVVGVSC